MRAGRVTFEAYAEQWRADQLHHRSSTAEVTEQRLKRWAYPTLGHLAMSSIKRSDIQRTVNVAAASLAPSTVDGVSSLIASVFKAAVIDRIVAASPCVGIRVPAKAEVGRVLPLTVSSVRALLAVMPQPWATMASLGAATGMRSGELRALSADRLAPALHLVGDLRPKAVVLTVDRSLGDTLTFGPPKSAAGVRSVAVGPSTVALLADHLACGPLGQAGLVFHDDDGGPLSRQHAGRAWRSAVAAAGISVRPRSGWHDLRHHHASLLIASGLSVRAVADRLGHADVRETLATYAHLWPSDEQRAVEAVEAVYG